MRKGEKQGTALAATEEQPAANTTGATPVMLALKVMTATHPLLS